MPRLTERLSQLLTGARGLAKAGARLDRPPASVIDHRRRQCAACPDLVRSAGLPRCGLCGCVVAAKTAVAGESCPAGHW